MPPTEEEDGPTEFKPEFAIFELKFEAGVWVEADHSPGFPMPDTA